MKMNTFFFLRMGAAKTAGLGWEFTINIYVTHDWLILRKSGRENKHIKLDIARYLAI